MFKPEYTLGNQPWARTNIAAMFCPYCGKQSLLRSFSDVADDDLRVELYCDNSNCDVREFNILAKRTEGLVQRADALALYEIDEGTAVERLSHDINIMDPEARRSIDRHQSSRLQRRRRKVKIEITPL